jgi:hypothetical protein
MSTHRKQQTISFDAQGKDGWSNHLIGHTLWSLILNPKNYLSSCRRLPGSSYWFLFWIRDFDPPLEFLS